MLGGGLGRVVSELGDPQFNAGHVAVAIFTEFEELLPQVVFFRANSLRVHVLFAVAIVAVVMEVDHIPCEFTFDAVVVAPQFHRFDVVEVHFDDPAHDMESVRVGLPDPFASAKGALVSVRVGTGHRGIFVGGEVFVATLPPTVLFVPILVVADEIHSRVPGIVGAQFQEVIGNGGAGVSSGGLKQVVGVFDVGCGFIARPTGVIEDRLHRAFFFGQPRDRILNRHDEVKTDGVIALVDVVVIGVGPGGSETILIVGISGVIRFSVSFAVGPAAVLADEANGLQAVESVSPLSVNPEELLERGRGVGDRFRFGLRGAE